MSGLLAYVTFESTDSRGDDNRAIEVIHGSGDAVVITRESLKSLIRSAEKTTWTLRRDYTCTALYNAKSRDEYKEILNGELDALELVEWFEAEIMEPIIDVQVAEDYRNEDDYGHDNH